ncbi:MAG: biotin--[acetyl-CoA-carboxylase] ligase [Chloroflexota bacterium]
MNTPLSAEQVTRGLNTRLVGGKVLYYPRLTSTMDAAREAVSGGAREGTVIVAGEQTAARGRVKRRWLSPQGSIAFSIILYPEKASLPFLVMVSALAVACGIEEGTGLRPGLKWPNDVLLGGKKVCGILLESAVRRGEAAYAVIGIGINANITVREIPGIPDNTTSLRAETGKEVDRAALIRRLLEHFERLYLRLPAGGGEIFQEWRERLDTLGRQVEVTTAEGTMAGIAEEVEPDGSLRLRRADGGSDRIVAGDITLRTVSG